MIKVITVKKWLNRASTKICRIFFEFWVFEILPFFVYVFLVEIFFITRDKWSLNISIFKIIPWEISEPWMVFNFWCSVVTKSICRFPLDHLIDKIGCFDRPSSWYFTFFNLNLFRQNMISDLFPWFSLIRTFTIHAFISHNSNGKIINRSCMILSAHNFWCHVSWSSRCILGIFWSPYSCDTKICYSDITFHINYQVFGFDISVDNLFFMTVFQSSN